MPAKRYSTYQVIVQRKGRPEIVRVLDLTKEELRLELVTAIDLLELLGPAVEALSARIKNWRKGGK